MPKVTVIRESEAPESFSERGGMGMRKKRVDGKSIILDKESGLGRISESGVAPGRNRGKDQMHRTLPPGTLQNLVRRKKIFDSATHGAFDSQGLISIATGGSLAINSTITDLTGALWLPVFEVSLFVNAYGSPNEYPNGSFFTGADAASTRGNYDVKEVVKQLTSTDSVVKHTVIVFNNSGATARLGIRIGMRFIINSSGDQTA